MKKQAGNIPYVTKAMYYRKGHYEMGVPPVATMFWDTKSWVKHIDATGRWITPVARQIEAKNGMDMPLCDGPFYKWLQIEGNRTGDYVTDIKAYLKTLGFVIGRDVLSSDTVRCLRYQHGWRNG